MRISKSTLIILVLMLVFSVLLANVANLLNTQAVYDTKRTNNQEVQQSVTIGDEYDHLIWFLQITDIHISIFRDPTRITQFKEFCDYTISAIKPAVVLASGDLTDAKTFDNIGSQQFEGEWKHYRNVLNECNIQKKTTWLDIRGNHDNFNVAGFNSRQNFFTNYSMQGKAHPRSYMYQVRKGGELYSFVGVDACLEPGPRRPFNFIGMLDDVEVKEIKSLITHIEETGSNHTIWFGHFPTSCIISPNPRGVRGLIERDKKGMVYVCGHLHQLGGLVTQMYTLQKEGFLELELGDWKDNRVYRLMAIDHGMFSFIDVMHGSWPVALITNPKHSLFMIPNKESGDTIKKSTHIRVLAFSITDILIVKARINDEVWRTCILVEAPLFVCEWDPSRYSGGLHHIEVFIKDKDGREKIFGQPFSLDNTRLSFDILSRIALMSDASTNFKIMFGSMIAITVVPLCILRYVQKMAKENKIKRPSCRGNCPKLWIRKLWLLSTVDFIFWPIVLYPVYLTFGPWTIGYLVEDHLGVIFAWGIFVNDTFLPGSFTYAYGFLQLFTFHMPLILILAHGVDVIYHHHQYRSGKPKTILTHVSLHLPFSMIIAIQLLMAYFFWMAYGALAFVLGFLRTWSIILAIVLWRYTLHLPERCIREIGLVWGSKSTELQTDSGLSTIN